MDPSANNKYNPKYVTLSEILLIAFMFYVLILYFLARELLKSDEYVAIASRCDPARVGVEQTFAGFM